jgi:peptidoglycan hydrolase-like protein with peptidoglycan-binding domain
MGLQSQLFRGDTKLQAAAVSDPDHITPGAAGPHVGKIQRALIQLDGAAIAQDSIYGPATAAAVLAFKQQRNIINRRYQTQADNIVGKMTIAALDREMLEKERLPPEPSQNDLELQIEGPRVLAQPKGPPRPACSSSLSTRRRRWPTRHRLPRTATPTTWPTSWASGSE